MFKKRGAQLWRILRGLLAAVGTTLAGMLLLAAAILYLGLGDEALSILNQGLKLLAILIGVRLCVGIGGARGLVSGAVVSMLYMILGYVSCCALGGQSFVARGMLLEIALGGAIGALFGMLLANLKPKKRSARVPHRQSAQS